MFRNMETVLKALDAMVGRSTTGLRAHGEWAMAMER